MENEKQEEQKEKEQHVAENKQNHHLDDSCWPDHVSEAEILLDDVSQV